jgi:SAM-dependent methyltransferase
MSEWWHYDQLPSGLPYDWGDAARGDSYWDNLDFHIDLGCGAGVKKGRLGIDRYYAPGVDLLMDLESLSWLPVHLPQGQPTTPEEQAAFEVGRRSFETCKESAGHLPFPDNSIESIISHHCLEHILDGFLHLMDECHRVLVPGGVLRIIVPLFPSAAAVADPDHKRYFMDKTFETFCGTPEGGHWMESFSVPYTNCRFEMPQEHGENPDVTEPTPPHLRWTPEDSREIRVALRKWG